MVEGWFNCRCVRGGPIRRGAEAGQWAKAQVKTASWAPQESHQPSAGAAAASVVSRWGRGLAYQPYPLFYTWLLPSIC